MSTILDRVRKVVIDHLGVEPEEAKPEANFIDDLGGDSLDIVELTMAFEEEFGIAINDDESENMGTVQGAVDLIAKKLGED